MPAAEGVVTESRDVLAAPPGAAGVPRRVLVAAHPFRVMVAVGLGAGGSRLGAERAVGRGRGDPFGEARELELEVSSWTLGSGRSTARVGESRGVELEQGTGELLAAGESFAGILGHRLADQRHHRRRHRLRVGSVAVDLGMEHRRQLAREGRSAVQQLVEDGPDRVDVGAAVDRLAAHLLGRHVGRGADDAVGPGQAAGVDQQLGDPEVHHLDLAERADRDVVGLRVPVDDVVGVGGADRAQQLLDDVQGLGDRQPAPVGEHRPDREAVDELHDDEEGVLVGVEVVDADDTRVIEGGDGRRLALETVPELRVLGVAVAQDLDRDRYLEAGVETAIDDAHRATPELLGDRETTEMVHEQASCANGLGARSLRSRGR